jgi:hypothetical protein
MNVIVQAPHLSSPRWGDGLGARASCPPRCKRDACVPRDCPNRQRERLLMNCFTVRSIPHLRGNDGEKGKMGLQQERLFCTMQRICLDYCPVLPCHGFSHKNPILLVRAGDARCGVCAVVCFFSETVLIPGLAETALPSSFSPPPVLRPPGGWFGSAARPPCPHRDKRDPCAPRGFPQKGERL